MKEKIYRILLFFSCALVIVCYMQINSLKNEITSLRNRIDSRTEMLNDNINDIYNNVDRIMEQRVSLLVESEGRVLSGDVGTGKAVLSYSVTPKEYSRINTAAILTVNGSEYTMTYRDGKYIAEMEVPLMEESVVESVSFVENGKTRTEKLDWHVSPRYDIITTVYADMGWSGRGSGKGGVYTWEIDSDLHITAERMGQKAEIVSVELVQVTGDTETLRQKLEENIDSEILEHMNDEYEKEVTDLYGNYRSRRSFHCNIKQRFSAEFGKKARLYAEVTDGDGLMHRCLLYSWETDGSGHSVDDMEPWQGMQAEEIYNTDKELIYSLDIEEEFYK